MEILIGVVCVIFFVFCISMAISTSKAKKKHKKTLKTMGATCYASLPHTAGLPIAESSLCKLYSLPDKILIVANGAEFNLPKDKLTDISITSDVEIQKHQVSSIGGAIGGYMLFGPVGALIGGRAKEKKTNIVHHYLIFTYQKEETVEYIAFDATPAFMSATKFSSEFRKNYEGQKKQINL